MIAHRFDDIHHYRIDITTEYGEKETLRVIALNERDARDEATALVLAAAYVVFMKKYYHLHEKYLASLKK